jgi:hypothetical protein
MRHRLTPTLDAHILAAWQIQLAAAVKTLSVLPEFVRQRHELLPRFATYYTELRALPRRVRRALQRHWKQSLAGLALWLALGPSPGLAATITVGGSCTLVDAITAANTDTATGGCAAGSGADTIMLPANSTHTLTAVNNDTYEPTGLPVVSSTITIEGQGSRIERESGAPEFRLLAVSSTGDLTLNETTVSEGGAPAVVSFANSSGGGVLNNGGTLTVTNCTISNNSAIYIGGGVANRYGTLTVTDSTIAGNTIGFFGGGVANIEGTLTVTNSTLSGNSASLSGGGVMNVGTFAVTIVTNSTLSGNAASDDGGVSNGAPLTLVRTLNQTTEDSYTT